MLSAIKTLSTSITFSENVLFLRFLFAMTASYARIYLSPVYQSSAAPAKRF